MRTQFGAGELVMEQGTPGDGLYVLVAGEVEVVRREAGCDVVLGVHGPGALFGEMSLLEQVPRNASIRALSDVEFLVISPDDFHGLLARSPAASLAMLRAVTVRLRATEAALIQREKLASLGTLAAGLAHELNNPAAAMARGVRHLGDAFREWARSHAAVAPLRSDPRNAALLEEIEASLREPDPPIPDASGSERVVRRLEELLADLGTAEAWRIAPALAAAGWGPDAVERFAQRCPPEHRAAVLEWAAAGADAYRILDEMGRSARSISDIVAAVRGHVSLDRPALRPVDIRESITNALVILRAKLGAGIAVRWEVQPNVPPVEAFAGELGQVWTNLVDNAIDAMDGRGTLDIRVRNEAASVAVEVEDSGPGIPAGLLPRVFDPFFTTKPPGAGTGLGLHIAHGIVVNRHRGRILVDSGPGRGARFTVVLPVRGPADAA